jgi:spoIIIJ-associated protein
MGFALSIEENRRDGGIELRLDGPDRKRLIAKDGELLSALEFVLNRMGRRAWPDEPPVHVVCSGFRSERDGELVEMVREAAAEVARSGQPCRLHAMNPYERRVVHMTVREHPGLTTVSEGDGFLKRVRVEKSAP